MEAKKVAHGYTVTRAAAAAADDDVEVNSVEDGDAANYDNQVPSSVELFASELRLNGDHSTHTQPESHTDDMQIIDNDDQLQRSDNRHVIHAPPTDTRRRHNRLVTSLQVRFCPTWEGKLSK